MNQNQTQSQRDRIASGQLWDDFCDSLKQAGREVLRPQTPDDLFDRAEGYRYLTRLLRLSLEKNIEFGDPQCPAFYSLSHETAKIGNDNPDNLYLNAEISGSYDYVIRGQRGTVPYLSFETKAGSFGGSGAMRPTGHVEIDELELSEDGSFELWISAREHGGNWLPMTVESDNVLVRQTFHDRATEVPAALTIECTNAGAAPVLDPLQLAAALDRVPAFVQGTASLFIDWMQHFSEHVNQLPPNDQEMCLQAGGDPSIYYHNSAWELGSDQALLIEVTPPVCRTWNFQLSNFWMESLDYRYQKISVNQHTARYQDDGRVVIVVAHQNPGIADVNWLSTAGHSRGAMLFRYVEAESFPPIATRLVGVEELKANECI